MTRRQILALLGGATVVPFTPSRALAQAGAPLHFMTIQELARLLKAKELSAVDVTRRMLDRIAAVDRGLKSYATVMSDQATADAKRADQEILSGRYRGPLHGVPVAVKDLCYTKGVRTMGGVGARRDFVPAFDATVVAKLRDAGAVVLGKLNLTEGATAGYNPALDVPLNPWNRDRWPGASSSGSGVATAAGLCFAAIGTDTGGSIRFPSSANGIVGLKPTYGRVSRYGVMAMADSLDHVGPMARSVADVAVMFDAIAGRDPRDATSLTAPQSNVFAELRRGVAGLRIGVDRDYALKGIDSGQAAALESAITTLAGLGARIVDVRVPDLSGLVESWMAICATEMAAVHAATFPSRAAEYGPYTREFLATAAQITPPQLAAARERRAVLTKQFVALLESVDLIASPAGGNPAWPVTHALQVGPLPALHAAWGAASPRATEFTMPMNLAGVPALCVPCGFSADGLPYSIQFTGRHQAESVLCRIGHAYEQATRWHERHPEVS